jgi:gamma-glutamyl:cysteine ligase YbdK (ATP-grasp superfamily)
VSGKTLSLFEGFGVEIEYMIVRESTLDVAPVADRLLAQAGHEGGAEVDRGAFAWSNELALHLVEMKTNGPAPALAGLAEGFQGEVSHIGSLLASDGEMLLPTGMHPWMDPHTEVRLWTHENDEIYRAFDRIFDCRGHGWGNLQSVHLNLPFADDDQFGRLHAGIRAVLPLLPALAASTPIMDGCKTGLADNRLRAYERNCARIPSITGAVIPEPVFSMEQYQDELLARLYRDIAPHDPAGTLQQEWLNARGAIARFDRMAIEIRLLDVQECPRADLALLEVIAATVQALTEETWSAQTAQKSLPVEPLKRLLDDCIEDGEEALVAHRDLLRVLGWRRSTEAPARRVWEHLIESAAARGALSAAAGDVLEHYLRHGTLATRLSKRVAQPTRDELRAIYRDVARCLADGRLFA